MSLPSAEFVGVGDGDGVGVGVGVPRDGTGVGVGVGGLSVMLSWRTHQPLAGVCTYTDRLVGPGGRLDVDTLALQPDCVQNGFLSAPATSGRFWVNRAWPSGRPPDSMPPRKISTSSAPAQPWAVRSTNQPDICRTPDVSDAPADGVSMTPARVLPSPEAAGPGAQAPTPGPAGACWATAGAAPVRARNSATRDRKTVV